MHTHIHTQREKCQDTTRHDSFCKVHSKRFHVPWYRWAHSLWFQVKIWGTQLFINHSLTHIHSHIYTATHTHTHVHAHTHTHLASETSSTYNWPISELESLVIKGMELILFQHFHCTKDNRKLKGLGGVEGKGRIL